MQTTGTGSPSCPVSVSGTGTAAKVFPSTISLPGSSRMNGKSFIIRGSGLFTTGTTGNCSLNMYANYPSGQYPAANITSAVLVNNVAQYNCVNNFVAGQFVTIAGCTSSTFNFTTPAILASANSTAITVAITHANISNEAATNAAVTIAAVPLLAGTVKSVAAGSAPFQFSIGCSGDASSNTVQGIIQDQIQNTISDATVAVTNSVPGVNLALEPPVTFTCAAVFGTSNANNAATLSNFVLETP